VGPGEEAVPLSQKSFENLIQKSCILVQNFSLF